MLKRVPLHVVLLALYPILALLGVNILEIHPNASLRALIVSAGAALVLLGVLRLVTRDWLRAGLLASFAILLFFSYGHVYEWLQAHPLGGIALGRHRFLAPVLVVVAGVGVWQLWRIRQPQPLTALLNIVSITLLIYPIYQIISFGSLAGSQAQQKVVVPNMQALTPPSGEPLPDVYYIVLDTYTRSDVLQEDFGFDNQPFVESLQAQGFYVPECSRSNYNFTLGSMTAAVNLNYINDLKLDLKAAGEGDTTIWLLLKQSGVRQELEKLGYQTVAFQTTYAWSEITDADIYLGPGLQPAAVQSLTPFEMLVLRTSAASIIADSMTIRQTANYDIANSPFSGHIRTMEYMLDELPNVADLPGQKFVFVHVLIPHIPYVFAPDGSLRTDSGFYSGEQAQPINEDYLREGYTGEIAYINNRMLDITQQIIDRSEVLPIIVIHGDHGLRDDNRLKNFEAIYLPGGEQSLYRNITPVNFFRVIFNTRFGTNYDLLPDVSYSIQGSLAEDVPEDAPACLP